MFVLILKNLCDIYHSAKHHKLSFKFSNINIVNFLSHTCGYMRLIAINS